ncbi:S8 family peptidase [Alkalihalophilus marmarensis]|uniref:S8 family peptidase n=1 Tax=Alkalihalophilus marmarensis TaxID=521377 RepID=UPI002DB61831|nr:S8 family serine peptidase [Alkalihalophilus marmarensis]MEC2071346.1 S8 family serine peptidase [Alkalihalophilus marmarensis]
MRNRIIIILAILFSFITCSDVLAESSHQMGSYIIGFNETIDEEVTSTMEHRIYETMENIQAVAARLTNAEAAELQSHDSVAFIEEDAEIKVQSTPTIDWGVTRIGAPKVWEHGVTGEGIKVAVMDTGISTNHPDLKIQKGASFVPYTTSYNDDNGHGTHVAGIIAAQKNDIGVTGVAPDAQLYALKVLDDKGNGLTSYVVSAINWSLKEGVDIINLSLGGKNQSTSLQQAIQHAYSQGVLFVAAAGNEGSTRGLENTVDFPAAFDQVIAVSAVDQQDRRAVFAQGSSATGPTVEVAAPGLNIRSTYLNRQYNVQSGTSMAAPHVAGHLALLKQVYPDRTHTQLRQLLRQQTVDLGNPGRDTHFGFGRIAIPSTLRIQVPRPLPPTGVQAKVENWEGERANISVTWQKPTQGDTPTHYNIYRNNQQVTQVPAGTLSYTDNVAKGTYTYSVATVGEAGEQSDRSQTVTLQVEKNNDKPSVPSFTDVRGDEWFADSLYDLRQRGILEGYPDGTARPNQVITRGEAAVLMTKALGYEATPYQHGFIDVRAQSFQADYIQTMIDQRIFAGYSNQSFRPHIAIARGEVAAILTRGFTLKPQQQVTFSDLSTNYFAYYAVIQVARANVAVGYKDGTFRPHNQVTRAEFASFLSRAIESEENL